jgi:hypothetical protein
VSFSRFKCCFAGAVLASALAGCAIFPATYGGAPLEGRVVEAKSGRPLDGVIVVQYWELRRPTVVGHSNFAGALHLEETVTDTEGRFAFKPWGMVSAPPGTFIHPISPFLSFFKPGFLATGQSNFLPEAYGAHARFWALRSDWDGKTIELEPADPVSPQYAGRLSSQHSGFGSVYRNTCDWLKMPRMMVATSEEDQRLAGAGIRSYAPNLEQLSARCGAPASRNDSGEETATPLSRLPRLLVGLACRAAREQRFNRDLRKACFA